MAETPQILPIVVGTAGHIDHGKSSLVKRLTGIDPDRLKEEKERGLTIDLGFAPLTLPDGRRIGLVDVPGHERFVRNMVAGATGVDLALLVVAADDSVMPQTREHVDILDLLEVRRCIVAITKCDLVEDEMIELVREEIAACLAKTQLEVVQMVAVSSTTGEGIDGLHAVLGQAVSALPIRPEEGGFRMPIQRVFSRPGFGTVVTGIPIAGSVRKGEVLEVMPGGQRGRIRGLHAYGGPIEVARAGHSTAINLTDVQVAQTHRGDVVAEPGLMQGSKRLEVRIRLLPSAQPLRHLTPVRFHVGTKEALGKISLLDARTLLPGGECLGQLLSREPVVVGVGDRFLLRLETPPRTVGGGVVLSLGRRRERRFREEVIQRLEAIEASTGDLAGLLLEAVRGAGLEGMTIDGLQRSLQRSVDQVRQQVSDLLAAGQLLRLSRGGERYIHPQAATAAAAAIDKAFADHFHRRPMAIKLDKSTLRERAGLTPEVLETVLAVRVEAGQLEILPDGGIKPVGRDLTLDPGDASDLAIIQRAVDEAGHSPRTKQEVCEVTGLDPARLEKLLVRALDESAIVEIAHQFLYGRGAFESARQSILTNCGRNRGELVIPELRDDLGTSRKFLIPILEHFDSLGLTRRRGNIRVLA
jgi:selenocysteine-specific elongation factor